MTGPAAFFVIFELLENFFVFFVLEIPDVHDVIEDRRPQTDRLLRLKSLYRARLLTKREPYGSSHQDIGALQFLRDNWGPVRG